MEHIKIEIDDNIDLEDEHFQNRIPPAQTTTNPSF